MTLLNHTPLLLYLETVDLIGPAAPLKGARRAAAKEEMSET